jgi:hypothetical protein
MLTQHRDVIIDDKYAFLASQDKVLQVRKDLRSNLLNLVAAVEPDTSNGTQWLKVSGPFLCKLGIPRQR